MIGSFATSLALPTSDLDIAITLEEEKSREEICGYISELTGILQNENWTESC